MISQCAMPAFEGLFPDPHNEIILDLLFALSTWHTIAKFRMHTDSSLNLLEMAEKDLGYYYRQFIKVTSVHYAGLSSQSTELSTLLDAKGIFKVNNFKFHNIAHYVDTIKHFGTTDSYSTQIVSELIFIRIMS